MLYFNTYFLILNGGLSNSMHWYKKSWQHYSKAVKIPTLVCHNFVQKGNSCCNTIMNIFSDHLTLRLLIIAYSNTCDCSIRITAIVLSQQLAYIIITKKLHQQVVWSSCSSKLGIERGVVFVRSASICEVTGIFIRCSSSIFVVEQAL